jgi:hypothetical protein
MWLFVAIAVVALAVVSRMARGKGAWRLAGFGALTFLSSLVLAATPAAEADRQLRSGAISTSHGNSTESISNARLPGAHE